MEKMKAIVLKKYGDADSAFSIVEKNIPIPTENEVLIKVDAFGLNFADVMARLKMYKDAPPAPCVIGYEVVGYIEKVGSNVKEFKTGQRVVAFTRFGGYAQYALTDQRAVAVLPEEIESAPATALATQYCTAYYAAYECVNLHEGDRVLVQAAAGGVGTAIVQLVKRKNCILFGTAGTAEKLAYLKEQGVDYPINYRTRDFAAEIDKIEDGRSGPDFVFDSVGGKVFSQSRKILNKGGKIVAFGASGRLRSGGNIFSTIGFLWQFGLMHPVGLLMKSQGVIGVNMLRIADSKPYVLQRCLQQVVKLAAEKEIKPQVGAVFKVEEIAKAHRLLEKRNTIGKVAVKW